MTDYTKLTGKEINKLQPGDWVAWRAERGKPIGPNTKWLEAQLMESPVRCHQVVFVRLGGARISVEKNRLFKPPPIVEVDRMHEVWNYDS
jgi:hypothetical protein